MEKLPHGEFGVMHGLMPVSQLKEVCHKYNVSINDYLVACFVWSVYKGMLSRNAGKSPDTCCSSGQSAAVFRFGYYKNFFVMISAEFTPTETDLYV